jgi:hypothetical protein
MLYQHLAAHRLFAQHGPAAFGPSGEEIVPPTGHGFEFSFGEADVHSVQVWGDFRPGWSSSMPLGLAAAGISILRGFARRPIEGVWNVELELQALAPNADPESIDYAALAMSAPRAESAVPIVLDSYHADGSSERGRLFLEVQAPDRVGFLGSLLERFAALSLCLDEMTIDTRGGRAFDQFFLTTADGDLPSDESCRALTSALDALVVRPAR